MTTRVINFYAGPGTGKSTTAAMLFALLKLDGHSAELVTEYAKDRVWEGSFNVLQDQLYVFGKQQHRIFNLLGKVEYVVTDSPLLLSLHYGAHYPSCFRDIVVSVYGGMNNIDFFLTRSKPYQAVGRMQTESQAREIDEQVLRILDQYSVGYAVLPANDQAARSVLQLVLNA